MQLLAQHLIDGARAAGNRNQRVGAGRRGRQAGDQRAFAVADEDQPIEAGVGFEQASPGRSIGDILLDAEVALIRCRRTAGGNTALVVAQAGDAMSGQGLCQALEAVVVPAGGVVAVAVGRPRAGDQQSDRQRLVALRPYQGAMQRALSGLQADWALHDGVGRGLGQAGKQGQKQ
ncbi:hypothetical protein D9M68_727770 [compost metagenome]